MSTGFGRGYGAMGERVPERAAEMAVLVDQEGDRAPAVVAMALAAMSGFVTGLLAQESLTLFLLVAALLTIAGLVGWWLRGAV